MEDYPVVSGLGDRLCHKYFSGRSQLTYKDLDQWFGNVTFDDDVDAVKMCLFYIFHKLIMPRDRNRII